MHFSIQSLRISSLDTPGDAGKSDPSTTPLILGDAPRKTPTGPSSHTEQQHRNSALRVRLEGDAAGCPPHSPPWELPREQIASATALQQTPGSPHDAHSVHQRCHSTPSVAGVAAYEPLHPPPFCTHTWPTAAAESSVSRRSCALRSRTTHPWGPAISSLHLRRTYRSVPPPPRASSLSRPRPARCA